MLKISSKLLAILLLFSLQLSANQSCRDIFKSAGVGKLAQLRSIFSRSNNPKEERASKFRLMFSSSENPQKIIHSHLSSDYINSIVKMRNEFSNEVKKIIEATSVEKYIDLIEWKEDVGSNLRANNTYFLSQMVTLMLWCFMIRSQKSSLQYMVDLRRCLQYWR